MDGRDRYLLRAALRIVDAGMRVFPLRPGAKTPALGPGWQARATADPETVRRWWRVVPYNIGVPTGDGLLVIDLDAPTRRALPHGRQILAALAHDAGAEIPRNTRTVVTAGGGQHLYFRVPPWVELRNTAGALGPRIDTRAAGGYVVGPGSVIGRARYRLVCPAQPQPLPGWLLDRLRPPPAPPATSGPARDVPWGRGYVDAVVRGECDRVATADIGTRNAALFRAAARLGQFVAAGALTEDQARRALAQAAAVHLGVAAFDAGEVERTLQSGLRRGTTGRPGAPVLPPGAAPAARRPDRRIR